VQTVKLSVVLRKKYDNNFSHLDTIPHTQPMVWYSRGGRDGQNLISWRWSLPLPTNPVWRGSMHAISSYCGNTPTHTPTDRTDYNTLRRS